MPRLPYHTVASQPERLLGRSMLACTRLCAACLSGLDGRASVKRGSPMMASRALPSMRLSQAPDTSDCGVSEIIITHDVQGLSQLEIQSLQYRCTIARVHVITAASCRLPQQPQPRQRPQGLCCVVSS